MLQETAHRAGLNLPVYTTIRSGPGHVPVFSCTVELAGLSFTGEPARTKKQAQKNAAIAAWSALKRCMCFLCYIFFILVLVETENPIYASSSIYDFECISQAYVGFNTSPNRNFLKYLTILVAHVVAQHGSSSSSSVDSKSNEEQEQVTIARVLASLHPSKCTNYTQNDHRHRQQQYISMCRKSTLPGGSLYPMQFHNWAYPSYSPEIAMYHLWQQEQLLLQQNRLLAFPVSRSNPSIPPIYPFMQSVLQPNHCIYFPAMEQVSTSVGPRITVATSAPSICFSDHLVPNPIRGRSTVTIQEIQEEKTEEAPDYSTSVVSNPLLLSYSNSEPKVQESVQEDGRQRLGDGRTKNGNVNVEGNRTGQFEWAYPRIMDFGFKPVDFQLQSPCGIDSSRPNLRHQQYPPRVNTPGSLRPPSSTTPVMNRTVRSTSSMCSRPQNLPSRMPVPPKMRTAGPSCSARLIPERMEFVGVRNSFMAPAVRIRSVVPVCSAPPPRQLPISSQEGVPPNMDKKNADHDDMLKASTELGKLKK